MTLTGVKVVHALIIVHATPYPLHEPSWHLTPLHVQCVALFVAPGPPLAPPNVPTMLPPTLCADVPNPPGCPDAESVRTEPERCHTLFITQSAGWLGRQHPAGWPAASGWLTGSIRQLPRSGNANWVIPLPGDRLHTVGYVITRPIKGCTRTSRACAAVQYR